MFKFKKHFFEILLFVIVVVLFLANYKRGTYLTGWDSIQTDFNPLLGIKRALFAVWEEYQSFGLVSGMAHAADLVRAVFVWLISYILPQNMVRYVFLFSMLLLGALGMYRLLQLSLRGSASWRRRNNPVTIDTTLSGSPRFARYRTVPGFARDDIFPFFGSLFYLLNLGTIQIFSLPYEPFSIFFASLPWCIWIFLINIVGIEHCSVPTNKRYLLFFLINLFTTPAFYVQTLFVVYILVLFVLAFGILINWNFIGNWKLVIENLKNIFFLFLLIFFINSFWLLPQLYFLKNSGSIVAEAKINQLSTEDMFYQNREKGTLNYFLKMEGFYYNLFDMKGNYLFAAWQKHFTNPFNNFLQIVFAFIIILGIFRKNKYRLPFLFLFILVSVALLNATPPFSWANNFVRKIDIINQIFRSPFTKFIIPYSLVASYFFASGLIVIKNVIARADVLSARGNPDKVVSIVTRLLHFARCKTVPGFVRNDKLFPFIIFILLMLYALPAFQGHFISPEMKVKIPNRYFELMDYFKQVDKNSRIGLLPDYTFWGWFFHKWGYNGSGFLWYGIEQPIISRTFDVWSDKSESYFWEIKLASEAEDEKRLEKILEKYDIDYLILDYSLLPVSSTLKGMQFDRIEKLLKKSPKVSLIANWKDLNLYKVKHDKTINDFVATSSNLPNIGPEIKLTNDDLAYLEYGDYMTGKKNSYAAYYPFLDFTTQTRIKDKKWEIKEDKDNFYLSGRLQNNKLFTVPFAKKVYDSFDLNKTKVTNCSYVNGLKTEINKNSLLLSAKNGASACIDFNNANLEQKLGYLIKIQNQKQKGRPLFFYILDQTKKQAFIEDRLKEDIEYYLLPPRYNQGVGYYFSFQNTSYKGLVSVNKLTDISIYSLPYEQIKNIKFVKKGESLEKAKFINDFNVTKKNYFLYKVTLSNEAMKQWGNETIVLYQSFHPGWEAYVISNTVTDSVEERSGKTESVKMVLMRYFPYFFGDKIESHFPINNWANGWRLRSQSFGDPKGNEIIILFWPQYLEFTGFVILVSTFGYILFKISDQTKE